MKAKINRDMCIGCGVCATLCPDVFEMDDENIAVAKQEDIPADLESDVQGAADSCPVNAIEIDQ